MTLDTRLADEAAMTLREALDSVRYREGCPGLGDVPATTAAEALSSWKRALAEHEPAQWERRLSWDGLNEAAATLAIRRSFGTHARSAPWRPALRGLQAALVRGVTKPPRRDGRAPHEADSIAFQEIWDPVSDWALDRLSSCLSPAAVGFLGPNAKEIMRRALVRRLSLISEGVLLTVFNRQRDFASMVSAYQTIDGVPGGQLPTTIYDAFVHQCRTSAMEEVFSEFPVVARHLATAIDRWHAALHEALERVAADRAILAERFGISASASIVDLSLGLSDPHHEGRVVMVFGFGNSGDAVPESRVVYKPKDMRLVAAFQRAIDEWPVRAGRSRLRSLTVVPRDRYGYMEFVSHLPASDESELERFYLNAGRLTAVLYLLGCTDCHHENLVAHGDQLLLIDAETLLEPTLRNLVNDAALEPQQRSPMQIRLAGAITRSGLLPSWEFMGEASRAVDISAFGADSPLSPTQPRPGWVGVNSDGMVAGMTEQASEVPTSLPCGVGQRNRFGEFIDTFCHGFRDELLQFIPHRQRWIQAGGVLDSFRGLPRRLVVRPTQVYFKLLLQLLEPDALRDEAAQGIVLEKLSLAFLAAPAKPMHWSIFRAEVLDMESLDVPAFEHLVDSESLHLPGLGETMVGLIRKSGLEACRERISRLDLQDIDLQERLIRGVSAARWIRADAAPEAFAGTVSAVNSSGNDSGRVSAPQEGLPPLDRLGEALRIAANLERDSLGDLGGGAEWLGLTLGDDGNRMSYGLLGPTLYSGTSGIGVFFAALGADRLPIARDCVSETIRLALTGYEGLLWRWWRDQPLGLNGAGGAILALQVLGRLDVSETERYREAIDRLVSALRPERVRADVEFDIMSGCAGLIGPLLRCGTPASIALARVAGDHVVASQGQDGGWTLSNGLRYSGFAHGSAGISAALSALFAHGRDDRIADSIVRAIEFERSCFIPASGNWRRHLGDDSAPKTAWCHGAPGMALSRLCMLRRLSPGSSTWRSIRTGLQRDLDLAVETTARYRSPARLDHVCCGTFGRSAVLRIADRHSEADLIERLACEHATREGGLYGFGQTARVDTPSLFRGSAGVGLALLRSPSLATVLSAGLLD